MLNVNIVFSQLRWRQCCSSYSAGTSGAGAGGDAVVDSAGTAGAGAGGGAVVASAGTAGAGAGRGAAVASAVTTGAGAGDSAALLGNWPGWDGDK